MSYSYCLQQQLCKSTLQCSYNSHFVCYCRNSMVISFAHKQIIFSQHFQLHPVLVQLTFFPGVTPRLDRFQKEKLVCSRYHGCLSVAQQTVSMHWREWSSTWLHVATTETTCCLPWNSRTWSAGRWSYDLSETSSCWWRKLDLGSGSSPKCSPATSAHTQHKQCSCSR